MDQDAFTGPQAAPVEEIRPDREERLRNRGGVALRDRLRDAQALFRRGDAVLSVSPARHQRADALSHAEALDVADGDDLSADLESRNVGGARRRRIFAHPLHDVGAIDARGGYPNQDFTGARLWNGSRDEPEDVRSARSGDLDRAH